MSKLGTMLVRERLLTDSDRRVIQRERGNHRGSFARSVLALGLLTDSELAALFAAKTTFSVAPKDLLQRIEGDALGAIPGPILQWFDVIPVKKQGATLHVAMVDPTDREVIQQLEFFSGMLIRPIIAPMETIKLALSRHVIGKLELNRSEFEDFLTNHSDHASRIARRQAGSTGVIDISDEPTGWGTDSAEAEELGNFELLTDDDDSNDVSAHTVEPAEESRVEAAETEDFAAPMPDLGSEDMDEFADVGDDISKKSDGSQDMIADVFPDDELGAEATDPSPGSPDQELSSSISSDFDLDPGAETGASPELGAELGIDSPAESLDEPLLAREPEVGDDLGMSLEDAHPDSGSLSESAEDQDAPDAETGELGDQSNLAEPEVVDDAPAINLPDPNLVSDIKATPSGHVATLNRALISLALLTDRRKAMTRFADSSDKVGIEAGALLKLSDGVFVPGVQWRRGDGGHECEFDSLPELDMTAVSGFLANLPKDSLESWVPTRETPFDEASMAWFAAPGDLTHLFVRSQNQGYTIAMANLHKVEGQPGLVEAFTEVVRAAGQKF